VVELALDLDAAPLSARVEAKPHRHPVVGVDGLQGVEPHVVERLVEPPPELPDLVRAAAGVGPL
jgi:hypothetical protein